MKRQAHPTTKKQSPKLPSELRLLASLNNAASIFASAPLYRGLADRLVRDLAFRRLPKGISPSEAKAKLEYEIEDLISRRTPLKELEEFCERMRGVLWDREDWCRCAMEALKAGGGNVADPKLDCGADNWSNRLGATLCKAQKRMLLGFEEALGTPDGVMDGEIQLMVEIGAELRQAAEELDAAIELKNANHDDPLSWTMRAIALIAAHPDWPVDKVAKAVGKNRGTLYKNEKVCKAIASRKAAARSPRRGYLTARRSEGGRIEAIDDR